MVLHDGQGHDVVVRKLDGGGQHIDGFGRVLCEDDPITSRISPDESGDHSSRVFVRLGGQAGLEASTSVDTRVPTDEGIDFVLDDAKRRGTRRVVEVDVPEAAAACQSW